jgi:hypothetical protein
VAELPRASELRLRAYSGRVLQRLVGVVIILVAGLLLIAVTAAGRGRIGGAAELPSGLPMPGSCTTWIPHPVGQPATTGSPAGQSISASTQYFYPAVSIADCGRPHGGLLISIDYSRSSPRTATLAQIRSQDGVCRDEANEWLGRRGLVPFDDRRGGVVIRWVPALTVVGRSIGPDAASRAAGSSWSGCALASRWDDFSAAVVPTLPGICLGVRPKFLTFVAVSGNALVTKPSSSIGCAVAHPAQVLAFARTVTGNPSRDQENQSCRAAARRYIGTSDPGFDNSIVTEVIPGGDLVCYAEAKGNFLLDGSLLGVGNGPLPWAS